MEREREGERESQCRDLSEESELRCCAVGWGGVWKSAISEEAMVTARRPMMGCEVEERRRDEARFAFSKCTLPPPPTSFWTLSIRNSAIGSVSGR